MKVLRSWPAMIPAADRGYVVDLLPKLVLTGYDYGPLAEVDDDAVVLEWDVAVGREDLDAFVACATADPGRVIVAPYRLYVSTVHAYVFPRPVWAHRRADGTHIDTGEASCALFGFGMVYLPHALIRAYRAACPGHFSDGSFSGWHLRTVGTPVPICWDVHPVHLHYQTGDIGFDGAVRTPAPPPVVLTELPDPAADERRATQADDPMIAALLRERAGLARYGKTVRILAVNQQLALRGYKET
jgi:hypothetical protein